MSNDTPLGGAPTRTRPARRAASSSQPKYTFDDDEAFEEGFEDDRDQDGGAYAPSGDDDDDTPTEDSDGEIVADVDATPTEATGAAAAGTKSTGADADAEPAALAHRHRHRRHARPLETTETWVLPGSVRRTWLPCARV